jgi:hypothetical protein
MSSSPVLTLPNNVTPEWLELVRDKVESLRYGVVQIVVHNNHVTQIEQTEKMRLDSPKAGADI